MATAERPDLPDANDLAVELDAETKDVLDELIDGEQHSTKLRKKTGLSRQALHRRLDRLENLAVIATEKKQPAEGGQARKHARLTDRGEELIDEGLIEGITDTNQNVETLADRLDELGRELRSELDRKPSRFDVHDTAEREASQVRDEFDRDLETLRGEIENVERQARRAKELAGEAQSDDLSSTVSTLETRVKGLKSTVDRLETRTTTYETRLDELERAAQRRDRQLDAILEHVSGLCIQVDRHDDRLEEAESTATAARGKVDRKTDEMDETLGKAVRTINDNADHVDRKIRAFDRRVNQLEDALEDATDLDESIRAKEEWIENLEEEIRELSDDFYEQQRDDGGLFF